MLNISKDLFTAWNKEGLLYCHWKSNEHLLPGLEGTTDLDVLLSSDDKEKGEVLLRQLDFLKCKSQYGSRYPGVDDWIGFDKETGALIHLHLHFRLVTGHKGMKEYSLPWADMALQTRVFNEEYGVYTIEPNLELVTLYTRIGLKADFKSLIRCRIGMLKFDNAIYKEIVWLKERVDMQKVQQLIELFYGKRAAQMMAIVKKEKIDSGTYLMLRKIAEKSFKDSSQTRCFVRLREVAFFCYQKVLIKPLSKLKPIISRKVPVSEKGLMIAFLGQDGAGKTTVTQKLMKWWRWKMEVRYVYLGSGDNYNSWKKRLVKRLPTHGPLKYLRSIIALTDTRDLTKKAYRYMRKAEKYASKGGVVILDRYPQMIYAGICDGPKIRQKVVDNFGNGVAAKILLPLANTEEKYIKKIIAIKPDLVFKLILPPEESLRRKPQERLEAVTMKHEIVKSLVFEGSDVYTIDATMPFDQEMVMIKNIIWQHIQK